VVVVVLVLVLLAVVGTKTSPPSVVHGLYLTINFDSGVILLVVKSGVFHFVASFQPFLVNFKSPCYNHLLLHTTVLC